MEPLAPAGQDRGLIDCILSVITQWLEKQPMYAKEYPQDWKESASENGRKRQAISLRRMPQA